MIIVMCIVYDSYMTTSTFIIIVCWWASFPCLHICLSLPLFFFPPPSLPPSPPTVMDDILTEFVSRTQSDPALAHDLLEAAGWNLDTALAMYDGFYSTEAVEPEDEIRESMLTY